MTTTGETSFLQNVIFAERNFWKLIEYFYENFKKCVEAFLAKISFFKNELQKSIRGSRRQTDVVVNHKIKIL